ncbi:hypothetical protein [Jiella marina]|uniref:hypothetical protein n=1 Tax=Jiella sp. LLJ827 TaxID=2917712 RepID=UPI0021010E4E|nr:hypothetical protein [Jiella sp. LLJ827]MCQ0986426.1 hypothetical protein [Jiella sp. LLJ827]
MNATLSLCDQLLAVADRYCEATGKRRGTVSAVVLRRGSRLDEIAAGADIGTRSFERAVVWFSDNWPEGLAWPQGVTRPQPEAGAAVVGGCEGDAGAPLAIRQAQDEGLCPDVADGEGGAVSNGDAARHPRPHPEPVEGRGRGLQSGADAAKGGDIFHDGENAAERRSRPVISQTKPSHELTVAKAAGEDAA